MKRISYNIHENIFQQNGETSKKLSSNKMENLQENIFQQNGDRQEIIIQARQDGAVEAPGWLVTLTKVGRGWVLCTSLLTLTLAEQTLQSSLW